MGFLHPKFFATTALLCAAACSPSFGEGDSDHDTDGASAAAGASSSAPLASDDLAADGVWARPIAFAPCTEDPELQCGSLDVPVDHTRPFGAQLALAVIKAPAFGDPRRKRGSIFVNPGGPGGSGVDFVRFGKPVFAALRAHFDIVSFDPRGTARSSPILCTLSLPPLPGDGSLEALAAFYDQVSGLLVQACAAQNGALAAHVGTNDVARDMDRFRAALGERELNYLGFSYGTILGASYATLFPQRTRAMVLDANVPAPWLGDYLIDLDGEGSAGAELALRRLDQLCRADAACPLRTAGVVATLDRVVARLDRNPVAVPEGIIDGAAVLGQTFSLLYNEPRGWPLIAQGLALIDGGDLSVVRPRPIGPEDQLSVGPLFSIICNDSRTRRPGLDYLPTQAAQQQLYPHFGGINLGSAIIACTRWPLTPMVPVREARTRHPIVMIGNDFDPATPMAWSRNMATTLGSPTTLVRYRGGGHGVYGTGIACIDDAVNAYFDEPSAPPRNLTCPARALSFAPTPLPSIAAEPPAPSTIADVLDLVVPRPTALPRRR